MPADDQAPNQSHASTVRIGRDTPRPILLYDGICGLCNRFVQFILRRDSKGTFLFAPLQSALAARILARHGANAGDLDAAYVVLDHQLPGERLLSRSDAARFVLSQIGGGWAGLAALSRILPRAAREAGYRLVARNRYRIFGRYDECMLPSPEARTRFLDL